MITHSFGIVNYFVLFGYLTAMMLVGVYFSRRQKQQTIIFAVVAGFWLSGWGQCICYYVKLNYIYVNSCQSVYFRLDVYHWSVSGYRNFTAGFYFYIPFFGNWKSHQPMNISKHGSMCAAVCSPACHLCCFILDVSPLSLSSPCWPCALHRYRPGDFGTVD